MTFVMKYTQEQLNYFRLCHVTFNLVPVGLRQIFKQEWDFLYRAEWKDSPKNGLDFYNRESKASRKRNAQCLATIQKGDTAKWDCTCLFFAILYSDSIGKTLQHVSPAVKNDVDDIRQVRNEIAHITEGKLTDADFRTSVDRVLDAFTSLGLPVTEIQEIKKQTTFPIEELEKIKKQAHELQAKLNQTKSDLQEKESRLQSTEADLVSAREENKALTQEMSANLQPFCILPLTPPHDIISRSEDIKRITKKMEELYGSANGAISTVYLSGNPGCGKSQLAREIGQEFSSKQTGELTFVATLNAESVETLAESYLNLGSRVGITEYAQSKLEDLKRERPEETIEQLHRLIRSKVSKFTKWLIIADNVVVLRSVRDFLPQTGSKEWGHGQVLITTQDSSTIPHKDAPCTYHESLSRGMKEADAMKLLENVSQVTDQDQVKTVVEALDYQPLALAAAAYYMANSGSSNCDWTKYLHEISTCDEKREAIENLLANDENSAYPKTTLVAVEMALRRAIETDEVLRQTFSFLAICAHDDLPIEAILQFVKAKLKNFSKELIKIKILRSSLILYYSEEGSERTYLHLHSIVHVALKRGKVLNMQSSENDHNRAEAVKVFKSLLEENRKKYAILKKLTPHCKSFLNHKTSDFASGESVALKTLIQSISLTRVIEWLGTLAWVSYEFCDLLFAENVANLACNLLEKDEGDLNASTKATIFNVSGCVYKTKGKYDQAEELLKQALMIRETIFGVEHEAVAESCNNLALVYSSKGKYDQAIEHYEKGLRIGEKNFSKDPVYEATNCDNLASVYREKGDYWKAEKLHKRALTIFEKDEIFAKEQAICYDHLGSVYRHTGDYKKAEEFYQKAITIFQKTVGEEHDTVAVSYNNLAILYNGIGDLHQAMELHKKALAIREKMFGELHAEVAESCNNLAVIYERVGEYNQAEKLAERALNISKTIFVEEHVYVAASYDTTGFVYRRMAKYKEAKECHEKALAIRNKIFCEENADLAASYNFLGLLYDRTGKYKKAENLHKKALEIRKTIFGEKHADVAASYDNLATVYNHIGEHKKAEELHQKALGIRKKILVEEHADVAASYDNWGLVCRSLGEYNQAKELHQKALKIRKKIFGEEKADVAASYNNLALAYASLGEYNQAKELHEKALMIWEKIFGEEHDDVATGFNNLASVYLCIGNNIKAKELLEKALEIQKKVLDEDHTDVANTCNNLASVYEKSEKYEEAKKLREKALFILKKSFAEDHPYVVGSYENLASVYNKIGKHDEAN